MGYTTDLYGRFDLNKKLTKDHAAYLKQFNETRRMHRYPEKAEELDDPIRKAVGLPIGPHGGYYVGAQKWSSSGDPSVIDPNTPPGQMTYEERRDMDFRQGLDENNRRTQAGECQPGLWCQWTPTEDLKGIEWDGGEKFYEYETWLKYIIHHFLAPWGYVLNGEVTWEGEDSGDRGKLVVKDNEVKSLYGTIVYE